MSSPVADTAAPAASWRTLSGPRVVVHASRASYASQIAAAELRESEAAVGVLEELLQPTAATRTQQPLTIYLLDPLAESVAEPVDPATIVRIVQPEVPGEPVVYAVARACAMRWYGPGALSATLFLDGLAGVVAARIRTGPPLAEVTDQVRSEYRDGRTVSVFGSARDPRDLAIATAFVGYLLETYGRDPLRVFLTVFNADRRDEAVVAAYQRPLGELEEAWLTNLRRDTARNGPAWRQFLGHIGPLIRPHRARQLELLVYMALNMTYGLTLPLGAKFLVDNIVPTGNPALLAGFVLVVAAVYAANAALGVRRAYVAGWITQLINAALSEQLFEHLQRLSHRFYGRAKTGDLMTRMSSDLSVIQQAVAMVLGTVIFLALTTLVAAITVVILNPLLGVLVLIVVPLFAFSYSMLRGRLQQASLLMQTRAGEVAAMVQENLSAHEVVKAFGMERRASQSYHARMQEYLGAAMQMIVRSAMFESSLMLAIMVSQTVVLGAGGYLVMQGQLTIGTLLAFVALLPTLFQPIATLSMVAGMIQRASGALDRVTELLDEPVSIADAPAAQPLPPLQREIRLESVRFGYTPDRPVLVDVNLVIPAGTHVAIVGLSGSGKSTLVGLLLRFWDPDSGRIMLDGHDLREVTLESVRRQIGLVFQDTFVFDTTVRENIAMSRAGASDADIAAAVRAARLDDYVLSLPAGLDTVLGERGVRMSGGQRQRLAIARALLRDPRLLVLDEATSALDAQTEREILETLLAVTRGRTTLTVTHRLSLAAAADHIVVLESGRVVEQGHHDVLVKAGGFYERLWQEQMRTRAGAGGAPSRVDADRLACVPLFSGLSALALSSLASRVSLERYAQGEDVVREGDPGDRLYVIARGEVDVLVSPDLRRVNVLGPGDYFGELALLTGAPRSATIRTTQPTELYAIDRADFVVLLHDNPAIAAAVTKVKAQRQRQHAPGASSASLL